jgi:hypothetical protein
MAMAQPLSFEWGELRTRGENPQAMVRLLRSSTVAPSVQRPSARGTTPWVVQFGGAIREEWKSAMENAGASIHGYVPENALLVEASPESIAKIAGMDDVVWAGEVLPAHKKSKAVRAWAADAAADAREFAVVLFRAGDKPRVAREFGEMNVFVSREEASAAHPLFHVRLSPKQVDEVANWGEVEWIEPHEKPRSWGTAAPDESGGMDDVGEALRRAFDEGRRVVLLVRGIADGGSYGVESRAIDRFAWEHPEMLVVAAAGNAAVDVNPADGVVDAGSVGSPATAKNALAVGAAEGRRDVARIWYESWPEDFAVEPIATDRMAQADGPQGMAAFSGRGPCADGRTKPDLVAPGTFIAVSRPAKFVFTGWGVAENTNEIHVGGTGVAAEQVAAAAEQARQWLVDARGIAAPSAALVKALLVAGARDLAPGQYGTGAKQEIPGVRPNNVQGFGLLDLAGALQVREGEFLDLHDTMGLVAGGTDVFELNAGQAGSRFVLAMAYSDAEALSCAGRNS